MSQDQKPARVRVVGAQSAPPLADPAAASAKPLAPATVESLPAGESSSGSGKLLTFALFVLAAAVGGAAQAWLLR